MLVNSVASLWFCRAGQYSLNKGSARVPQASAQSARNKAEQAAALSAQHPHFCYYNGGGKGHPNTERLGDGKPKKSVGFPALEELSCASEVRSKILELPALFHCFQSSWWWRENNLFDALVTRNFSRRFWNLRYPEATTNYLVVTALIALLSGLFSLPIFGRAHKTVIFVIVLIHLFGLSIE